MSKICVVGSANADLYVEVTRLPEVGETLQATGGGQLRPGGKGANQAAAVALLGLECFFLGQVGKDTAGELLKHELLQRNVNIEYLRELEDTPTGQAVVLLLSTSENSIVIIGGANSDWVELPEPMFEGIQRSQAVLLQREIPDEVNLHATVYAKTLNKLVIMDAGGKEGMLPQELLRKIDVFSPNVTELERISGVKGNVQDAARTLLGLGVKHLVTKMGSQGSWYIGNCGEYRQLTMSTDEMKVLDTTGAGDCFTAALAVKLLEYSELSLEAFKGAMSFASAAAFLTITKVGAMPSLPTLQEVTEFLHSK